MCTSNGAEIPTFLNQRNDLLLTQAAVERLQSHTVINEYLRAGSDISLPRGIHVFLFSYTHTHTHTHYAEERSR